MLTQLLFTVIAALLGGIIGGGGVTRLGVAALENRLRDVFATRENMNGLGERLTAVQRIATAANDTAGAAHSKALEVEGKVDHYWEVTNAKLSEAVIRIDRAAEKMEQSAERLSFLEGNLTGKGVLNPK